MLEALGFSSLDALIDEAIPAQIRLTRPLQLPAAHDGWTFSAPLRSAEHPLLITGERGRQRVAALAFDVLESDLPLRVAFPLLIHGTVQWLAGEHTDSPPVLSAGEVFQIPSGKSVAPAPLTSPPSARIAEAQPSVVTGFFQPLRNGFYRVMGDGSARVFSADTSPKVWYDANTPNGGDGVDW